MQHFHFHFRKALVTLIAAAAFLACSKSSPAAIECDGSADCTGPVDSAVARLGLGWTVRMAGKDSGLKSVNYSGTEFGTVGDSGGMFTSTDGLAWTRRSPPTNLALSSIVSISGKWVVLNDSYEEPGWVTVSGDDVTWQSHSGLTENIKCAVYAGGMVVAVGNTFDRATDVGMVSVDGLTWTNTKLPTNRKLLGVASSGSLYVAVGGTLQTSVDGKAWALADSSQVFMRSVAYGAGKFVAVGENGSVVTSPDGKTWTAGARTGRDLYAVLFTGKRWVAVGLRGVIVISDDAVTWTAVPSGTGRTLHGLAMNGKTLVAVGDSSTILTSP